LNTYLSRKAVMNRVLILALIGGLSALVWFSLRLAANRIFQVDECQNVYVARILATGRTKTAYANLSLVQFPLAWVAHGGTRSMDLFTAARFLMLGIFWLNLVLIALATGEKLFSRRGLIALVAAATLAPLWDYGFEIRHDNLLLTGVLLTWWVVRFRPAGIQSYVIAGAIAAALQFVAFKAFVYTLPLSLAILACPRPSHRAPRWKLALAWIAGALAVFLMFRLAYGAAGLWDLYLADFRRVLGDSTGGRRFAPWDTLSRLLGQTPLLLALGAAALVALAVDIGKRGKAALTWDGNLPEAFLFGVAFAALVINPAPYPYNLLHLVSYGFLFVFRYASKLSREIWDRPALCPLAAAVLIFAHLVPFGVVTSRHWNWTNFRQKNLMRLAEAITDPARDPVYDGMGIVPTRPSIHFRWFLEALNIESLIHGAGPHVRDMLAARPAAVFIPNYRTDWLPEEDHAFIRERYVSVADDFWVLGKVLPAGGGTFEIVHSGRYRISSLQESDLAETCRVSVAQSRVPLEDGGFTATLDGLPVSSRPVDLTVGIHRIECKPGCQPAVVWVGPKLDRVGRLIQRDHRLLFVNWY
jgi:hypothetical protein